MRIALGILLGIVGLTAGCTKVTNLTRAECRPAGIPGDVVLEREAFLYRFKGERDIAMMDHLYRYARDFEPNGRAIMITEPPLQKLPVGTRLSITKLTRESGFDGPYRAIVAKGVAHGPSGDVPFRYTWGLSDEIKDAPWESPVYAPQGPRRVVSCNHALFDLDPKH